MEVHRLTSQANMMAPECTCPLPTFVFEFELCPPRAFQGRVPVQATTKSGTTKSYVYLPANYIPHTFNRHHVVPPLSDHHSSLVLLI